eukprot:4922869-Alexandrium_andersonii.AAC.1
MVRPSAQGQTNLTPGHAGARPRLAAVAHPGRMGGPPRPLVGPVSSQWTTGGGRSRSRGSTSKHSPR